LRMMKCDNDLSAKHEHRFGGSVRASPPLVTVTVIKIKFLLLLRNFPTPVSNGSQ
jgi:hypothetical protein